MQTQINSLTTRELLQSSSGLATSDGGGVKLTRLIGQPGLDMLDPFLLFDSFASDQADDYIKGFPSHPHRGFETVTYLLEGKMRHRDNAGHEGVIQTGGVQWMSAGRGIVHSEMPEQENGLLQGFQLWLNLPSYAKMSEPNYQEFGASDIPVERWKSGTEVRVIAGTSDAGTEGPVRNTFVQPHYFDIRLPAGQSFQQHLPEQQQALIYVIDGDLTVGRQAGRLSTKQLGVLGAGESVQLQSQSPSHLLLLSADPLREPVVRGGPFVMNTREEVLQAFEDFQNNRF